ncbi:MAG: polysaccharide biosynthesis tyrosine autokinase [Desulfobacteraceae bacterium]|nr:polysaccharide biosynthesis tyrosine autokinase [Desulfobacteraceae bacterium]MBC2719430.1 polysaccharide biosynthesis tyrosine autokinase [Desulfobacteraceae bacterium]
MPKKIEAQLDIEKPVYEHAEINGCLVTLLNPDSFEAGQFKILRTNLLFPLSGSPPRTLMITSAVPGEGKSFVSANLAISIAQGIDEHVLLMDCDIRKPCLHTRFGFNDVRGLSDYLANGISISSVLLKTKLKKLTILPGGKPYNNPAELLTSEKMSALLKEVKIRYKNRYIIIDSPPPQLTAESSAIARQVDGIILVIKYGSTNRETVSALINIIGKEKILGVIINWFDMRSSSYSDFREYGNLYTKYQKK